MNAQPGALVRWVFMAQLALSLIAAAIVALAATLEAAMFTLVGGGIALLLTGVFAIRLFSVDARSDPQAVVQAFFRAAAMKLLAAFVLFGLAAKFVPQHFLPIVIGFMAATSSYWLALRFTAGANKE